MSHYGENEPRSAANLPPSNPITDYGPSRTRQSDAYAADINNIMARYEETGVLPTVNRGLFFADVSDVGGFDNAITLVHGIERAFLEYPPDLRKRFDNDPAKFVDFTQDPNNHEEMVEMGLLKNVNMVPDQTEIDQAVARLLAKANPGEADPDPQPTPE